MFHPAHRRGPPGRPGHRHGVPVNGDLGAEAAADIGRDHPDGIGIEAECSGQGPPGQLGVLRAGPEGRRPSAHRAAAPRTSSGTGATR